MCISKLILNNCLQDTPFNACHYSDDTSLLCHSLPDDYIVSPRSENKQSKLIFKVSLQDAKATIFFAFKGHHQIVT